MEEQVNTVTTEVSPGFFRKIDPRANRISLLTLILFAFFLLIGTGLVANNNLSGKPTPTPIPQEISYGPYTLVYGFWTKDASEIKALNLQNGVISTLASLPSNIKHVQIMSPSSIAFIKNTNEDDHGSEIVAYDLISSKETVLARATAGFGIDDYRLSPNKKYLAFWEVQFAPGSSVLLGGKSQVVSVNTTNSSDVHIIATETSDIGRPVLYPLAVSDNGDIIMDRFLPNSGAGWGYEISISNFSGTGITPVASMQNGTISTQPIASADGKTMVFAGYNGSAGPGTEIVNGFRRGLVLANTVDLFDVATRSRKTLTNLPENASFSPSGWDPQDKNKLFINVVSKNSENNGIYVYDVGNNFAQKLGIVQSETTDSSLNVESGLGNQKYLLALKDASQNAGANLGNTYDQNIVQLMAYSQADNQTVQIETQDAYMQYISFLPNNYLSADLEKAGEKLKKETDQLQLATFVLKPQLVPKREGQQSKPKPAEGNPQQKPGPACRDIAIEQCNQMLGTNYSTSTYIKCGSSINYDRNVQLSSKEFADCLKGQCETVKNTGTCSDSPLYLYGNAGLRANIFIGTPIFSPSVPYNPEAGFAITLLGNGEFVANGKKVSNIDYDYTPAVNISRPKRGIVVPLRLVAQTLEDFGEKLGLTSVETTGVVQYAQKNIASPYVFLSFFDNKTSQRILPLYFDPMPETYRNIVFYFEKLESAPQASFNPPEFDPIIRRGFTAIEISFFVK